MKLQRFVFNLHQALGLPDEEEVTYIYANDPIVLLDQGQAFSRHTSQRARFPTTTTTVDDPIFGSSLDWAYNEYIVHRLWVPDERDDLRSVEAAPLGNAPPQGVRSRRRPSQLAYTRLLEALDRPASDDDQRLYLFNVIVALEWLPSGPFMRQLEWAFRRASDLLYDVTNGCMAFGQVVFADADWMGCADVQVMASNRLLPRSWVSGLLDPNKYTPIRIGRGVWNRKSKIAIPWDEPEAYGTLVHEWAHYALGLRDEYLWPVPSNETLAHMLNRPERPDTPELYDVVIPRPGITSTSIMATPEGNSELGSPIPICEKLRQKHYPRLKIPEGDLAGPGRLPLPLPSFHRIGQLAEQHDDQLRLKVPDKIKDDASWVYVLRGPVATPQRMIAQGTLDARSREQDPHDARSREQDPHFLLLGVEPGDTVILVEDADSQLKVWRGAITGITAERTADIQDWQEATPAHLPLIDIQPNKLNGGTSAPDAAQAPGQPGSARRRAAISIQVKMGDSWPKDDLRLSIAPVEDDTSSAANRSGVLTMPVKPETPIDVAALDGHVMVTLGEKLLITTYSQGGGPATTPNVPANPIAAGSSDGEGLLFFYDPEPEDAERAENAKVRVITTTLHGMQDRLPDGARARSNAFSIASNEPLRVELKPTLIIFNDVITMAKDEDLLIYRLTAYDEQTGEQRWTSLPTYVQPGDSLAATPLSAPLDGKDLAGEKVGGKLLLSDAELGGRARMEYYRLFSINAVASSGGAGSLFFGGGHQTNS